jgi:3-dehydroquinate synthase
MGHAIENLYQIPHGHAVSIGMGVACKFSEKLNGFKESNRLMALLKRYGLPPQFDFDKEKAMEILLKDKKKSGTHISFILLKKIGKAEINTISIDQVNELTHQL